MHGLEHAASDDGDAADTASCKGAWLHPFVRLRLKLADSRPSGRMGPTAELILTQMSANFGDPSPSPTRQRPRQPYEPGAPSASLVDSLSKWPSL